jgi:hypothetical protein
MLRFCRPSWKQRAPKPNAEKPRMLARRDMVSAVVVAVLECTEIEWSVVVKQPSPAPAARRYAETPGRRIGFPAVPIGPVSLRWEGMVRDSLAEVQLV